MNKQERAFEANRSDLTCCDRPRYMTHADNCPIMLASMVLVKAEIEAIEATGGVNLPIYREASRLMSTNRLFEASKPAWMQRFSEVPSLAKLLKICRVSHPAWMGFGAVLSRLSEAI